MAGFTRISAEPRYTKPLPEHTRERVKARAAERGVEATGEALFLHAYAVVTQQEKSQNRLDEFRNVYGFCRNMVLSLLFAAPLLWFAPAAASTC